jgi:hypothetical protein
MSELSDQSESVCFRLTKKIAEVAARPAQTSTSSIESEVHEAVRYLTCIQLGREDNNLRVLAVQLEFAKNSLAKDTETKRLLNHAKDLVEQQIQTLERKGTDGAPARRPGTLS